MKNANNKDQHPRVFISYSHKDESWKDRVVTHLRVLEKQALLDVWDDRRIKAGEDWHEEIQKALDSADVAILMISADFLTSDFILGAEVPALLERRQNEGLKVIPVITKPCAWQQVKWLKPIQARPKDGKPLSSMRGWRLDEALAALAKEILDMEQTQPHPRVFISYSHDSVEHIDRVLALSNRLREDGTDCILDQYETSPPEGWTRWMDRNMRDADFVLMICTETYYRRVMLDEEPGKGLGVKWEGKLIYQHIYNADSENTRFIPVLFKYSKREHIPTPLQGATYYAVDTKQGYEDLYRRLTNQPRVRRVELGRIRTLPKVLPLERRADFPAAKVDLAKLPATSSLLFGRERELQWLDKAWESGTTHIFSLVGWGG